MFTVCWDTSKTHCPKHVLPEKLLNVYQSGGTLCQGIQHVQSTCGYNKQILKSKILLAGKTRCQFIFIRITCRCSHNLGFKRAYQRHRDTFPREHMQFFLADAPCGGDAGTVHACLACQGFCGMCSESFAFKLDLLLFARSTARRPLLHLQNIVWVVWLKGNA